MTHDTFETVELGQAEALIEIGWGHVEELQDKFDSATPPYVEF
jgi:hypothetical protein